LGTIRNPKLVQFTTPPFQTETEISGHIVVHLNISMSPNTSIPDKGEEKDIDIFLTVRHLDPSGKEIYYTSTTGDPAPLTKGWLRVSLRKVAENHPKNRSYPLQREYLSTDVQPVIPDTVYGVDVETRPTNVVVEKGGKIIFEVSSGDTQGSGIFSHGSETDRPKERFAGLNNMCFGEGLENYVTLPINPQK
jgi:hypothetical protein